MNQTFVEHLLERTADWHTRLGQNILYINLLSEQVTPEDYKKYLSAIYTFVSGFEEFIYPELEQFIPDITKRKKAKLIASDLANVDQQVDELETLPESYFRSMYTDPYAALGALYVLESRELGDHLIQAHLQNSLENSISGKLTYFVARGEQAGPMWDSFLEKFTAVAEASDKQENMIDGALRTLRLLDQLMTDKSVAAQ